MAHPRRFVALDRKALTVGLTAALLTVPMAGVSGAVTLDAVDSVDSIDTSTLTAAELEILETEGIDALLAHMESTATPTTEPVKEAVAPVVDPVADAVEKAVREVAPAPIAKPAPEQDGGSAKMAGGNTEPVSPSGSQPASSSSTSSPAAPSGDRASAPSGGQTIAPSLSNELRATSGFSAATDRPNLQPAPVPLVSSPFMVQAPVVSGEAVQTPLTALAAAPDFVSSVVRSATATPLSEHPSGVPGALTATAAALLLMVGAGHVLHRNGDLRRAFAG